MLTDQGPEYEAHLYFRKARQALLSGSGETNGFDVFGRIAFTGQLLVRYPAPHQHGEEESWVLRERMTEAETAWNAVVLRRIGQSYVDHADALEAWTEQRKADGLLPEQAATPVGGEDT